MTENPSRYRAGNSRPDIGDAINWLDTLIKAHEADVLELLENALWHFSNHVEGEHTLGTEELLERLRFAIGRIKDQVVNKEIDQRLDDLALDEDEL